MAQYFECPIQYFSAAFDVLIKILESLSTSDPNKYASLSSRMVSSRVLATIEFLERKHVNKKKGWPSYYETSRHKQCAP